MPSSNALTCCWRFNPRSDAAARSESALRVAAAAAMAVGAQRALGASVGLALTGVAGPAEQDGMPVGTLCVGLAIGDAVHTATLRMPGQREQMRQMSVITALDFLRRTLSASGA